MGRKKSSVLEPGEEEGGGVNPSIQTRLGVWVEWLLGWWLYERSRPPVARGWWDFSRFFLVFLCSKTIFQGRVRATIFISQLHREAAAHMLWYHFVSYHVMSYSIWHHIIWCHVIAYNTILSLKIWCYIILYQVMRYDIMLWYHVIWYRILWYHIMWHDIAWYNKIR